MKFCVTKKLILLHSGQLEPLLYKTLKLDVRQISKKNGTTQNLIYEKTTDIVRYTDFIYKMSDMINS